MTYNPAVANISRAEFDELMAIVRGEAERQEPLDPESIWRRDYLEHQRSRLVIGYQPDLFGKHMVTHYWRHAPAPETEQPEPESIEDKLERIRGDPNATFGPPRADRPAFLSKDEKAEIVRNAANWLRVGQRVRIVDAPGAVDPAFGPERFLGRAGVVWRLCRSFTERCYVFLDPVGGERTHKIEMVELRDLEPLP